MSTGELNWVKSSYSSSGSGDCLELALTPTTIHIRDSKTPRDPHLTLSPGAWQSFVSYAGVTSPGTPSTPCGTPC
ncbi:DUF397 domain-containing protein [Streptomyces sp. S3(2020)]|uniref:DUF397 domain-containing protein n=1 Tax=Streptomyces sp. S3(2020) TaxID=2732044 RepID=UPI0014883B1B|nr:DUF397 domain-containing protein [Streptomyces sp. S3(2020)]NNN34148.1 DUF397 domain-containing protein [Streptomyces sp. S3(2020)]